jgi:hypothetical protein
MAQFANSPNAKTILFPVEATQLIGSLGGIGELVRDAIGAPAAKGGGAPVKRDTAPKAMISPEVPDRR